MKRNYILVLAGVISATVGIIYSVPALMKGNYILGVITTFLLVGGLVLLAFAFED